MAILRPLTFCWCGMFLINRNRYVEALFRFEEKLPIFFASESSAYRTERCLRVRDSVSR
jgi:hypothetical protein